MIKLIGTLIITLLLGTGTLTMGQMSSDCEDASGTVERSTYPSAILGQVMFYSVYLPPCYSVTDNRYPVIFLQHGSNEDDGHWQRLGLPAVLDRLIVSGEIVPLVVVMPFGNVIANRNRFDQLSWGMIFRQELMPAAASQYRIATTRSQRAIGGISRGGFWAYQIALSDPDLFSTVGGHSAFFDRYHAEAQFNPLDLVHQISDGNDMRLWLDRGADDFAAPGLDLMHERLLEHGLAHEYQIYPEGEHNNLYWSQHVEEYIRFYAQGWSTEQRATPVPVFSGFATNTPNAPLSTATATPRTSSQQASLFPVVAFSSFRTRIDRAALDALLNGQPVSDLILADDLLVGSGEIVPHPDIPRIPVAQIAAALRSERDLWTLLPLDQVTLDMRVIFLDDLPVTDPRAHYPLLGDDLGHLSRITFSGVTAPARNTLRSLDENGVEWAASGIADYVRLSDFFHISNEVSFVDTCPQSPSGEYLGGANSMCSRPEHMRLFELLGVDVIELTGNHNADYGYDAYRSTLAAYAEQGYDTVGGGETLEQARAPLFLEHHGNRIAILACNAAGPYYALVNEDPNLAGGIRPGAADCDRDWLAEQIPLLAQQSDVLIVSVQYVEVEDYQPLPDQRDFFRYLATLGADIVIGSAAHKPQTFEWFSRDEGEHAFIHHGPGNLFFDQPFWGNMRFFLDTFYVYDGELRAVELYPGIIEGNARPRLMTDDERFNFLYFMFVEQNGF